MAGNAPFVDKEVPCPSCGARSRLLYPSPSFYLVADRERDHHVLSYKWSKDGWGHIKPQHYALWQCPACLVVEFTQQVERPPKGYKELFVERALAAMAPATRELLGWLRAWVRPELGDATSALSIHLAGLRIATLPEVPQRDQRRIGRVALRTAWLLREAGSDPSAMEEGLARDLVTGALDDREGPWEAWPAMPRDEPSCLRVAVEAFELSFATEDVYTKVEESMALLGLICEILLRLGENDRTLKAATEMHRAAMDAKREVVRARETARRAGKLNAHDERALALRMAAAEPALERAAEIRREVLDLMLAEHRPTCDRVLSGLGRRGAEEAERALRRAGVPKEVVVHLRRQGALGRASA